MKTIFLIAALCALFSPNVFGQQSTSEDTTESKKDDDNAVVSVKEISLARDDGSGAPGELAETFLTTDIPIHCLINLTSTKPALVKMNLVAVAAGGYKAEAIVISVSYKTNGNQNRVKFQVSPDKLWSAGKYRVDVFIDGKKSDGDGNGSGDVGSKSFEIQKSGKEIENKEPSPSKPKTTAKPRQRKARSS